MAQQEHGCLCCWQQLRWPQHRQMLHQQDQHSGCCNKNQSAGQDSSYSSNNTRDTPGRRPFISPAQDQGTCASCVGFAVTAAAEAAINVYKQQSWDKLGLSEQDLSFCKLLPRLNCGTGISYTSVISTIAKGDVPTWAARSCYGYTGDAINDCWRSESCSSQLPSGASLSWAYNANALNTMAKTKERILMSGCLQYSPRQPERLLKLVNDLVTLTALAPELRLGLPQVLTDVVTSNFGRICNLWAASRGPFRLCGKVGQLLAKVACVSRPQQVPNALPWSGCGPALGTVCNARCTSPAMGRGYNAVCTIINGAATWQVTGGCPPATGPIILQADTALGVTTPPVEERHSQLTLQACGSSLLSKFQQFRYEEGQIKLQAIDACLGVSGGWSYNGVQVVVYECDGTANQRWIRDLVGVLRPLHALGSCMDIPASNLKQGTRVQLYDCNKSKAQLFFADFMPYVEGRAGVVQPKANTSLCIAAPEIGPGKPVSWIPVE
ncbi:hypothetical protein OEZ86_001528 [Tetradesmus obliquus]|nr:hypothetical protein OEZ86_001528 [Tetradesmus obliquus]